MYKIISLLFFSALIISCSTSKKLSVQHFNHQFIGNYIDDYGIAYSLSDSMFVQEQKTKYRLVKWNAEEQYFIAQNAATNKSEPNLFTRIDYMPFINMAPFTWGFCLTTYNAKSIKAAEAATAADRANPRKGCGGYPFSRMKRAAK
jgi:hypothetical protein